MDNGQYNVRRISDFGVMENNGKESAFVKFVTDAGEAMWFGSLNGTKNPGKKMSGRDVTLQTLLKLGWNQDIDAFASGQPCFTLPDGVEIVWGEETYNGTTKQKVLSIYVPGYGVGRMDLGKAKGIMAGMKADIAKAAQAVATKAEEPPF